MSKMTFLHSFCSLKIGEEFTWLEVQNLGKFLESKNIKEF